MTLFEIPTYLEKIQSILGGLDQVRKYNCSITFGAGKTIEQAEVEIEVLDYNTLEIVIKYAEQGNFDNTQLMFVTSIDDGIEGDSDSHTNDEPDEITINGHAICGGDCQLSVTIHFYDETGY